ncbi:MAG: septum formation protein Maf [Chitinophagaceae bacterium]|nr:septum formation protein Maf [Chitinophagaceae bacterium]
MKKIILASGSPRRKKILALGGVVFDSITSDVDEDFDPEEDKQKIPVILAERKVRKVFEDYPEKRNVIVIGADTIVVLGKEILNKPGDAGEAYDMLKKLSGKVHEVITGVVMISHEKSLSFSYTTRITFRELSDDQIWDYINLRQPYDKAGGYAIQEEIGPVAVKQIDGSYFNVAGLPFIPTLQLLEEMGYSFT